MPNNARFAKNSIATPFIELYRIDRNHRRENQPPNATTQASSHPVIGRDRLSPNGTLPFVGPTLPSSDSLVAIGHEFRKALYLVKLRKYWATLYSGPFTRNVTASL